MLTTGTILSSRYEILSVLGKGGMGSVYLAQARELGNKKVAVKELELLGFSPDELPKAVEQFKKEARFLAHLEHPNLVPVSDFFTVDDKHYLVMAYVEGEDLQRKLSARGKPFSWEELKGWTESLIEVLSYLHDHDPPILFRDLKPSNIMVANSGRLHLIDFGIARTARMGDRTCSFLQGTGTRGFSPLEQFGCEESCDHRSDIYSLGAMLYYLLTGKRPPDAIERVAQKKALKPASLFQPELPAGMDHVLEKAMAISAVDRYQSVQEFGEALRALKSMRVYSLRSVSLVGIDPKEAPTEDLSHRKPGLEERLSQVAVACLGVLFLGLSGTPAKLAAARHKTQPTERVAMANVEMPTESVAQVSLAGVPAGSPVTGKTQASKLETVEFKRRESRVVTATVAQSGGPMGEAVEPSKSSQQSDSSPKSVPEKRSTPHLDVAVAYPKALSKVEPTVGTALRNTAPVSDYTSPAPTPTFAETTVAAKAPSPTAPAKEVTTTVTLPAEGAEIASAASTYAAPSTSAAAVTANFKTRGQAPAQAPPGYYSTSNGNEVAAGNMGSMGDVGNVGGGGGGGGGFGGPQRGGHGGGARQ